MREIGIPRLHVNILAAGIGVGLLDRLGDVQVKNDLGRDALEFRLNRNFLFIQQFAGNGRIGPHHEFFRSGNACRGGSVPVELGLTGRDGLLGIQRRVLAERQGLEAGESTGIGNVAAGRRRPLDHMPDDRAGRVGTVEFEPFVPFDRRVGFYGQVGHHIDIDGAACGEITVKNNVLGRTHVGVRVFIAGLVAAEDDIGSFGIPIEEPVVIRNDAFVVGVIPVFGSRVGLGHGTCTNRREADCRMVALDRLRKVEFPYTGDGQ